MGKLKERMVEDLALRNYKLGTCENYLRCAERFALHYNRSPKLMGETEIRKYLLLEKEKKGLGALKMSVVHPDSERETARWLRETSGMEELLKCDFSKISDNALHLIADKLLKNKNDIEQSLAENPGIGCAPDG